MRTRLLLDARVKFEVGEFGEPAAGAADKVVVVAAFAELVPHAPVLKRDAAKQLELLEELDGAKDRRPADVRQPCKEVFDGERLARLFDGLEHRPPGGR